MTAYHEELKKEPHDHYIQYVNVEPTADGNIELVVTMLPDLAELIHSARSTLHDNTYVHVCGAHNEWEVVLWHEHLNHHEFLASCSACYF